MTTCTICNLCEKPGTLEAAVDVTQLPCHVRRFNDHKFTVWRCTNCRSLHSKEDADLALFYRHYPVHEMKLDPVMEIGYARRLRLLRKRGLKRPDHILDFGCGGGLFVQYLHKRGYPNAVGFDRYIPEFADPALLQRRYDAVVSYDVIEHMDDPRECLAELASLLDVGGLLVIGTPDAEHIHLETRPFEMELSQPYHRHILSERVLTQIAVEQGCDSEHVFRRLYIDTLYPGLNTRFAWAYANACGGLLDPLFEPVRASVLLRSPKLLFLMFFGYFFPLRSNILISYRKRRPTQLVAALA